MSPEEIANQYYIKGVTLFDLRRHDLAELELRKGLSSDPYNLMLK